MGKVESAHGPLSRIYCTLSDRYPNLSDNLRLRFAVKALNDTAGTNGLVPSLLVLSTILLYRCSWSGNSASVFPSEGSTQRFNAMTAARKEAATIIAEKRIRLALKSNVPPSARYTLRQEQLAMVYSEKKRRWIQDIRIVQLSSKQAWINYKNRIIKVGQTQVIPQPSGGENNGIANLLQNLYPLNSKSHPNILLTEILQPNDPRSESPEFSLAKTKEITGLLDKKAFQVALK